MAVVARYQPVVELCGGDAEVLAGQYHIAGRRLAEDARPRGDELPGLRRGVSFPRQVSTIARTASWPTRSLRRPTR